MTTKLGVVHASYGIQDLLARDSFDVSLRKAWTGFGAFVAPFVATYFSGTPRWSLHYVVSGAIAISNTTVLTLVFRGKTQEGMFAD